MSADARRAAALIADPDQRTRLHNSCRASEAVREGMADQLGARDWADLMRARASEDMPALGELLAGYIDRAVEAIVAAESPDAEQAERQADRLGEAEDYAYDCARDRALLGRR